MTATQKRVRQAHQLPAGRHGIARETVVANQRVRLLAAVVDVYGDLGYQAMSVEAIIACAGVSRRTFYDMYRSREDVFLAAVDDAAERIVAVLRPWNRSARDASPLAALLAFAAEEPLTVLLCAGAPDAGADGRARRDLLIKHLAHALCGAWTVVSEVVTTGLVELLAARILAGHVLTITDLAEDLNHAPVFITRDRPGLQGAGASA